MKMWKLSLHPVILVLMSVSLSEIPSLEQLESQVMVLRVTVLFVLMIAIAHLVKQMSFPCKQSFAGYIRITLSVRPFIFDFS